MAIATLDDIRAIERTPFMQRRWPRNTYSLLSEAADRFGDDLALTWLPDASNLEASSSWTFKELFRDVTRTANLFRQLGCGKTDVVAYMLPNFPEAHLALWGAEAAGIAFAINPALSPDMVMSLLATMSVKLLVLSPGSLSEASREFLEERVCNLPHLVGILTVGEGQFAPAGVAVSDFSVGLASQKSDSLNYNRLFHPDDPSSAFCTGGTTGAPKVAMRTHGAESANACMLAEALSGAIFPSDKLFCGLPLFHVNATLVTGLAAWFNGAHVVLGPPSGFRDKVLLANFWRVVERYRIAFFSGVPTIYSALMNVPVANTDISSLRLGLCGAAPMPVDLFREFERTTGIHILEGYGLTETVCTATLNPTDGERVVGSVGLPLPYQDIRVVELTADGKLSRICDVDEVGTLAIAGPNVFAGYVDPAHNETAWVDFDDGRPWLNSGDLGKIDRQGYLWLTGRRKELIIRGGHNIDPKMIEEAMHRHPAVALAAAIGRPDPYSGEVPVVYVQLRDGVAADTAELVQFASREVSERAAIPKEVIVVAQLPVTAVGKLFKPALVLAEIEQTVRREATEAGVRIIELKVYHDPRRGPVAELELARSNPAFTTALGKYSFAHALIQPEY
jgi:fatty-acyl-CoA synthase